VKFIVEKGVLVGHKRDGEGVDGELNKGRGGPEREPRVATDRERLVELRGEGVEVRGIGGGRY
jgi:hypothetical protein